jgi:mitogen-activated protein kinase 1/3
VAHHAHRKPLFPGRSCFPLSADAADTYQDRRDQLNVIFGVIGTPCAEDVDRMREASAKVQPRERASA